MGLGRQFNAGAIVLRPSLEFADELLIAYEGRDKWMDAKSMRR